MPGWEDELAQTNRRDLYDQARVELDEQDQEKEAGEQQNFRFEIPPGL